MRVSGTQDIVSAYLRGAVDAYVWRLVSGVALIAGANGALAQQAPFLNINPSWSPDGRWLVFESRRHGDAELYVIGADGSGERRLTWSRGDDTHAAWSPDGSTIVFDSNRDGAWNLYVIGPDGSGERRLTQRGSSRALDVRASSRLVARRPADRLRLRSRRR